MASPMAIAGMGMQAAGAVMQMGSIFAQAEMRRGEINGQLNALELTKAVESFNTKLKVRSIRRQGLRMEASQKSAFIKGGVKLEGSAIDVLADTAMDFAESQIQTQRAQDWRNEQMSVQQANLISERSVLSKRAKMKALSIGLQTGGNMAMGSIG